MPKNKNKKTTNNAQKNKSDKDIIEFLKYGIDYSENRISIVDNKASILIAVQTLLFGLFVFIMKEVFWSIDHPLIKPASYVVLGVAFVIFVITVILLLQAICPSKRFLQKIIPIKDKEKDIENYVMWLDKYNISLKSWEDYREKINKFTLKEIKENYEKSHHISLQLVYNKYKFYPYANIISVDPK